ncbi:hypothetical protein R1flu_000350 [Riccia fluitans]|uniref:Uncharacterized protein n=1 Tax=Riccia fluitans TaxID=41844 RepID=A0ABD1Y071_9MARC
MAKAEAVIEPLVVILVVGRIVLALLLAGSGSLWYEAFGVVALTFAALITEFQTYRNRLDHLKPRSSISNGILLGAITVPTLLSARLLHMQKYSSATGHSNIKFDFSLALACSMSMLLRVLSLSRKQRKPSQWFGISAFEITCATGSFIAAIKRKALWSGLDGISWLAVYTGGQDAVQLRS